MITFDLADPRHRRLVTEAIGGALAAGREPVGFALQALEAAGVVADAGQVVDLVAETIAALEAGLVGAGRPSSGGPKPVVAMW